MKTTVKRNKTIKRTFVKAIKKIFTLMLITLPKATRKITRTLAKSITKSNGILVGDIGERLGFIALGLIAFVMFAIVLIPAIWAGCYLAYSINPELCDIILDFTGNLYQYFNK